MPRKKGKGRGRGAGQQEDAGPSDRPAAQVQPEPAPAGAGHVQAAAPPVRVARAQPAVITSTAPAPAAQVAPRVASQPPGAQAQPPSAWGRKVQPVSHVQQPLATQQPMVTAQPAGTPAQISAQGRAAQPVRPAQQPPATQVPAVRPAEPVAVATAEIEEKLQKLSIGFRKPYESEKAFPTRPGLGKNGRPIRLRSNHYPLNIPDGFIYHYDVEIESLRAKITKEELAKEVKQKATPQQVSGRRLSAAISREVMTHLFRQEPLFRDVIPAYDGNKNMFTRTPIRTGKRLTKTVTFREDGRDVDSNFKVSIQPVSKDAGISSESNAINLNCLHQLFSGQGTFNVDCYQAIMALDIIMRNGPSLKLPSVGRSFFLPPRNQDEVALGEGKYIWFGYYQSVRLDQRAPVLIVDKATTTFYGSGPLLDYIYKVLNNRNLVKMSDFDIKKLSNDLKTVQIYVTHLPYKRKYRIVRLTRTSALQLTFPETMKDGKIVQTSVADYFTKTYRKLQYPNLPCVQVGPENKKIYLPIEVCMLVEGQHYKRKLTDEQTSQMIRFACTAPRDRFDDIQRSCQRTVEDGKRYMKEFGLNLARQPLHLEGRVLDAPGVVYGNNKTIQPQDGSWDLRDTKFLKGAKITSWAILSLANDRFCTRQHLQKFADMVQSMGRKMDMEISSPKAIDLLGNRGLPIKLQDMQKQFALELIVIVLKDRATYSEIKQIAEVKLGLRTSCIQGDNVVKKCSSQLVCNILLKMNAKFDGQNSKLQDRVMVPILNKPVLIIGVDVSHSAPGDKVRPSVAAAVGGLDMVQHHYAAYIKVQKRINEEKQHVEVISDFKDMVKKLLMAFFRHTKYKPEKIIIYRDGVSEGEFATVLDQEIPQVDAACMEIQKDRTYLPPVTFIVVQKRHHTRFAPEDHRDGVGRAKNIPPGTTVDKEVTHPVYHDFFLCSHYGIQGTSRPAHYTVLRDDNKLSADELQKLSYHLCHTYARCTRSISLPAPVMYAHLAALRARQHLSSLADKDSASTTSDESEEHQISVSALEQSQRNVEVASNISMKMYFI